MCFFLCWFVSLLANYVCTMRAEIVAYMIYLEGPEYPEYVMHFLPKVFRDPQIWEYVW